MRTGLTRGILALLLVVTLSGCGISLTNTDTARTFTLTPQTEFDTALPTLPFQLLIEEPVATRSLNTNRIAVRRDRYELGYFADVRWSDRAPAMVLARLTESFENSGRITAVSRRVAGLRSDYELRSDLRAFQAQTLSGGDGQPDVHVALSVKLAHQPAAAIIASRTFRQRITAEDGAILDVVDAFDRALGRIQQDVVRWSLTEILRHHRDGRTYRERLQDSLDAMDAPDAPAARPE